MLPMLRRYAPYRYLPRLVTGAYHPRAMLLALWSTAKQDKHRQAVTKVVVGAYQWLVRQIVAPQPRFRRWDQVMEAWQEQSICCLSGLKGGT